MKKITLLLFTLSFSFSKAQYCAHDYDDELFQRFLGSRTTYVQKTGDEEFDAVLCGYSLRDAINLRIAISEIHRVLKNNGRFVIVDLGKPDEAIIRLGVSFYLKFILPVLALIAGGRLGLKFGTLYGTYKRWTQNKNLEKLLLEKFSKVEFEKDLMGGAIMVAAYK